MIYIAINITQKTKDWETWTPQKTGSELRCSGRVEYVVAVMEFTKNSFNWSKKKLKTNREPFEEYSYYICISQMNLLCSF
jgi:hypothetical protein